MVEVTSNGRDEAAEELAAALGELGFSQYEARAYVGLLGAEPRTGYAVAKATGVPQPKVYEALRRLVVRGAAFELAGEPARFVAAAPSQLIDQLEAGFGRRLSRARRSVPLILDGYEQPMLEPVRRLEGWPALERAVADSIARAERRIYLSARDRELEGLRGALEDAVGRGVDVVLLSFGAAFALAGGRCFTHASTERVLYRRHQARHLALVADSAETVWALAADGHNWTGLVTGSELVIAAIKDFIRHDIDFQRVYADFAEDLRRAYGPGLETLEDYRHEPSGQQSEPVPAEVPPPAAREPRRHGPRRAPARGAEPGDSQAAG